MTKQEKPEVGKQPDMRPLTLAQYESSRPHSKVMPAKNIHEKMARTPIQPKINKVNILSGVAPRYLNNFPALGMTQRQPTTIEDSSAINLRNI
ncbi:MAG: hypothetical protein WA902_00995 [Thermosynechococcaceae cyanobacterium]